MHVIFTGQMVGMHQHEVDRAYRKAHLYRSTTESWPMPTVAPAAHSSSTRVILGAWIPVTTALKDNIVADRRFERPLRPHFQWLYRLVHPANYAWQAMSRDNTTVVCSPPQIRTVLAARIVCLITVYIDTDVVFFGQLAQFDRLVSCSMKVESEYVAHRITHFDHRVPTLACVDWSIFLAVETPIWSCTGTPKCWPRSHHEDGSARWLFDWQYRRGLDPCGSMCDIPLQGFGTVSDIVRSFAPGAPVVDALKQRIDSVVAPSWVASGRSSAKGGQTIHPQITDESCLAWSNGLDC